MDVLPTPAWVRPADADRWREDMLGWTTHILARLGRSATGAPRVHKLAPWSIVLRVATTGGEVWFKENVPTLGPEPALLQLLSEWVPGRVPAPLGVDQGRGWLLLADHGTTLRSRGRDDDPALWADLVSQWSQTTRHLALRADALEAIGVPRLGPAETEPYLRERIGRLAALPPGDPAQLNARDAARSASVTMPSPTPGSLGSSRPRSSRGPTSPRPGPCAPPSLPRSCLASSAVRRAGGARGR